MLLEVRRGVNAQQPQRPPEIPEDPVFNTALLRLPAETRFPIPGTGVVQRIAVDLLTRLLTMAARDQRDTRLRGNARTGIPEIKYLPAHGDRLFVSGDGGPCKPASSPWCPAGANRDKISNNGHDGKGTRTANNRGVPARLQRVNLLRLQSLHQGPNEDGDVNIFIYLNF